MARGNLPTIQMHDIPAISRRWMVNGEPFPQSTVRALCKDGRLPAKKYGRRWMVRDDDLQRFEESGRTSSLPPAPRLADEPCPAAARHGL